MICDACNVREPWEHRCFGGECACEECREADRLFGSDKYWGTTRGYTDMHS